MKRFLLLAAIVAFVTPAPAGAGEAGTKILQNRCASCHNLTGPSPQTILELWKRDAPDLFYAGNKFQREWLVEWLQKPVRIRPAGVNYLRTINSAPAPKEGEKQKEYDVLYGPVLRPLQHLTLKPAEAEETADALMDLKAGDSFLAGMMLDNSKQVSLEEGEVLFDKVYGCLSCHQIEPNYGGFTGPEVYTAGRRLTPEFMLSYITRPKNWDSKIWMPNGNVKPADLQKIVNYLILLSKENFNAAN